VFENRKFGHKAESIPKFELSKPSLILLRIPEIRNRFNGQGEISKLTK